MKITKLRLKQIIKEELNNSVIKEGLSTDALVQEGQGSVNAILWQDILRLRPLLRSMLTQMNKILGIGAGEEFESLPQEKQDLIVNTLDVIIEIFESAKPFTQNGGEREVAIALKILANRPAIDNLPDIISDDIIHDLKSMIQVYKNSGQVPRTVSEGLK